LVTGPFYFFASVWCVVHHRINSLASTF
jgi:hypothetical protein